VVAVVGPRWIATAAAAGPSALVIWLVALIGLFVPLAFSVLELSSRYPEEGGIYVWSREAFGGFAGFLTGWTYWASCLIYFPGLLYFAAGNALFIAGRHTQTLEGSTAYFLIASLLGLGIAFGVNLVGLNVGKWLHNAGAFGTWAAIAALVGMGAIALVRFGAARAIDAAALVPRTGVGEITLWSTLAFAFGGIEAAAFVGDETHNPRRTIPRAVLLAGAIITGIYILGTAAVLVALPPAEVSGITGIMQAVQRSADRAGVPSVTPFVAALLTLGSVGGVGAWLASVARLPFVAGIDRVLPSAFARIHPRWGTPWVALLAQAIGTVLVLALSQAGTSVKGAYDVLVSMGVISYFIPFLFLFASMIRVQSLPPPRRDIRRVPGGSAVAVLLASVGFIVTFMSIVLAVLPPKDSPNPALAVAKVLGANVALLALGTAMYARGARRGVRGAA
jgi:amino acid transporter